MSGGILDAIDGALNDWSVSKDAMRWNPEAGEVEARSANSADFSLAMLPPSEPAGWLEVGDTAPGAALIREAHVVQVDGRMWGVRSRTRTSYGWKFELEPID